MNKNLENLTYHSFAPKSLVVFISYTWLDDNDADHGIWVSYFVNKLELLGVEVKYDKRTAGNSQTREFMEEGVNNSDFVICICSDKYVERFNKEGDYPEGKPGAINESELIEKRINRTLNPKDFLIAIIKNNTRKQADKLPKKMPDVFWFDFDKDITACGEAFSDLGITIFNIEKQISKQTQHVIRQRNIRNHLKTLFAQIWGSTLGSDEEKRLYEAWNCPDKNPQPSTLGTEQFQQAELHPENLSTPHGDTGVKEVEIIDNKSPVPMLWATCLGRWDQSYPGDKEIVDLLSGGVEK